MRFNITLNVPTRGSKDRAPAPTHSVICDAPVDSLGAFCDALNDNAFLIVQEFYKDGSIVYDHGPMILNTAHVAKVKEWVTV